MLQWGRPEGNMRRPNAHAPNANIPAAELEANWAAKGEDADAAPACETEFPDCKRVSES